jgi:hypothetical protein
VFVAGYNKVADAYSIIYPYEYRLLTDDSSLGSTALQALAEESERVRCLVAAYPNEEKP